MPEGSDNKPIADSAAAARGAVHNGSDAAQAFISYASADSSIANKVCIALEREGVRCWIAPRDVAPGDLYAADIVHAIDTTRVVVLVLSQRSADSAHVLREVERASSKRHPILSFRIDQAPLPDGLEYFLNTSQWLDASNTGAVRALPRLVDAVKGALGKPTVAARVNEGAIVTTKANQRPSRTLVVLAIIIATGLAYVLVDRFWLSRRVDAQDILVEATTASPAATFRAPTIPAKSIAVLPFADMSEKKDQEYFSDGLSEELIDHLAQNVDLKVIARSSSFAFKGTNEDVRAIAAKLGVTNLLQGSVRKAGNRLRITAQLIRASDGVLLWSETYDQEFDDVFRLQNEISAMVAKALDAPLDLTHHVGVPSASTQSINIEAYNLMLQGHYLFWRGNKGDLAKAVNLFQQALLHDPHYAVALAKLSRAFAWQGYLGDLTADEAIVKGREAAERAIAIDPNCAEAYFARGNIFRLLAGDWKAALSDYERAAALDPRGYLGNDSKGNVILVKGEMSGQLGDFINWSFGRLEDSPVDTQVLYDLAWAQQFAGQLEASAVTFLRMLEVNPNYSTARAQFGITLLLMGKNAEALAAAEKEPDVTYRLASLTSIFWASGRRPESDSTLSALEREYADRKAYEIAVAHAYRGEADAAFEWLDRAYLQRRGSFEYLKIDPLLQKLRGDPRFSALLRKAKLAE